MKKRLPAFTLMELLVVIGILAILSIPALIGIFTVRARQSVNVAKESLVSVLKTAHIYAREGKERSSWGINHLDDNSYRMWKNDGSGEVVVAEYSLGSLVKFENGPFTIKFNQGLGTTNGPVTIILKANNITAQVNVESSGVIDEL